MFGRQAVLGLIAVALLTLVSGAYAYWKLTNSESLPATSKFTSYPVELRMELDKTQFAVGELIRVRYYLKNTSNRTIVASFGSAKVFDCSITDAGDTPVYILSQNVLYTQSSISQTLIPGAEMNRTFVWDQTYGSRAFKDKFRQPVPPGTYHIEGLTAENMVVSYWNGWTLVEPFMYYHGEPTGIEGELRIPRITITIT